jgi:hypothetical protein
MIKNLKLIALLFLVFNSNCLFSKELPKDLDIPVELSKSEQKRLEKANELIKEGMDLWKQLNTRYNPEKATNYKIDSMYNHDAYPILIKAAKVFEEGNAMKYELYHKNCLDFWSKHKYDSPSGLENAKRFQKEAVRYIEKAQLNRLSAENYINEYVKAYDRFFEAISLEIIAAKKEGRALQIFRDWPVHYAYQWDDDVEKNLFPQQNKTKELAEIEPPKPSEKPAVKEVKPVVQGPVKELPDSMIIFYSVQIAAHTILMPESHIRGTIYKGTMKIEQIHEDGWYKYLIGHYKTYEEAVKLLNEVKVDKAFVVAYKNGKRVPLKEVTDPNEQKNGKN